MAESKYRNSCDACLTHKVRCSQSKPSCQRCTQHGQPCVYSQYRRIGRPPRRPASTLTSLQHVETGGDPLSQKKQPPQRMHPLPGPPRNEHSRQGNGVGNMCFNCNRSALDQYTSTPNEGNKVVAQGPKTRTIKTSARMNSDPECGKGSPSDTPNLSDSFDFMAEFEFSELDLPAADFGNLSHTIRSLSSQAASDAVTPDTAFHCESPIGHLGLNTSGQPATSFTGITPERGSEGLALTMLGNPPDQPQASPLTLQQTATNFTPAKPSSAPDTPYYNLEDFSSTTGLSSPDFDLRRPSSSHVSIPTISYPPGQRGRTFQPTSSAMRCHNHCRADLTEQLSRLSELQAGECSAPLDVILSQEEYVRRQRERILRCGFCMGTTARSGQTLMLIIMVLENLTGLFEGECKFNRINSSSSGSSSSDHTELSSQPSSAISSEYQQRRCDSIWDDGRPRISMLPHTSQPLIIGNFEIDEGAKTMFLKQLLRLHLARQMAAVTDLEQRLAVGAKNSTNYKVAREVLLDIHRRIELSQKFLAFT